MRVSDYWRKILILRLRRIKLSWKIIGDHETFRKLEQNKLMLRDVLISFIPLSCNLRINRNLSMKISYNWLKKYLPCHTPCREMQICLRIAAFRSRRDRIFSIHERWTWRTFCWRGKKHITKHPNADKLSLTTVDTGDGTPANCMRCSEYSSRPESNRSKSRRHFISKYWWTIWNKEVENSRRISEGMICAEDEIGLGTSHAGVMVLPQIHESECRQRNILKLKMTRFSKSDYTKTVRMLLHIWGSKRFVCCLDK